MEKVRRLVLTKLDNYFTPFRAFYLFHLIFLKSCFFSKNYFYFSLFSDEDNSEPSDMHASRKRKIRGNESEN